MKLYAPKGDITPETDGKRGVATKESDGDREYEKRADYVQQLLFAVVDGRLGVDGEEVLAEEAGDEQEVDGGAAEEVFVKGCKAEYAAVVRGHYHQDGERPEVVHLPIKFP